MVVDVNVVNGEVIVTASVAMLTRTRRTAYVYESSKRALVNDERIDMANEGGMAMWVVA